MSGVPYEMPPQSGLVAPPGTTCFRLPFASRAILSRMVIKQIGGPTANFTAALYSNASACAGRPESESLGDSGGDLPPDLYRVTPDLAGTGGLLLYFSETQTGGHGFLFHNMDASPIPTRPANGRIERYIYLAITHAAVSDCTFAVAIGGTSFND
jgi:hypothetical protein